MVDSDRQCILVHRPQILEDQLGKAARVAKDQSGLVLTNQIGDALIDFFPDFVGHQGFQRRAGDFEREI